MKRSAILVISLGSLALVLGCGGSSASGPGASAADGPKKVRVTPKNRNLTDNGDGSFTLGNRKCKVVDVIEDGEDNNNQVMVKDGRNGYMYTYGDSNGSTMSPEANSTFAQTPGGAQGSAYAACVKGKIAMAGTAYAGIGMDLSDPKKAMDLSKYDGLSFRARRGADSSTLIRVKVPDAATAPEGNICTDKCYNDFGVDMHLSEEWQLFYLPFAELKQMSGWGAPRPPTVDSAKIFGVQFQAQQKDQPFELCIDDLSVIDCD